MVSPERFAPAVVDTFGYEVDEYDLICQIRTTRDPAAAEESGEHYSADTPFDSIFGDEKTRSLFRRILQHVRTSRDTVTFPFRCDTQVASKFFSLTASVSTARHVLFFNKLLGVDPRPEGIEWLRRTTNAAGSLPVCSICNQIRIEGVWRHFQEGVELGLWPAHGSEMPCSSTVCEKCERGVHQRIRQAERRRL